MARNENVFLFTPKYDAVKIISHSKKPFPRWNYLLWSVIVHTSSVRIEIFTRAIFQSWMLIAGRESQRQSVRLHQSRLPLIRLTEERPKCRKFSGPMHQIKTKKAEEWERDFRGTSSCVQLSLMEKAARVKLILPTTSGMIKSALRPSARRSVERSAGLWHSHPPTVQRQK